MHRFRFPDWLQGDWHDFKVIGRDLYYRDNANLVKYRAQCVQRATKHPNRYLIYSRSNW